VPDGWWNGAGGISTDIGLSSPNASESFTFTNTPFGKIVAKKYFDANENGSKGSDLLEPYMAGWEMTLQVNTGTVAAPVWTNVTSGDFLPGMQENASKSITNAASGVAWNNLRYGSYRVLETNKTGWHNSDPGTDPIAKTADVGSPGVTVPRLFGNWRPCVVWKTINGLPLGDDPANPTPDPIEFQIRSGASTTSQGDILASGFATVANDGKVEFKNSGSWVYLVPDQHYQLVERVPYGFSPSLATVGEPFAFTPGIETDPTADNSYVAVDFIANATGDIVFRTGTGDPRTCDNRPPNMARTIGFWKNWSSVTGGSQDWILDQTLMSAPEPGIYIGNLLLSNDPGTQTGAAADVMKAYLILDKRHRDTGAKAAYDPCMNLASQYLAWRLNILTGADDYPNTRVAAEWAQYYLEKYKFEGTATVWLGGTIGKKKKTPARPFVADVSAVDAANMNYLAGVLDDYNNAGAGAYSAKIIFPNVPADGYPKQVYPPAVHPPALGHPIP